MVIAFDMHGTSFFHFPLVSKTLAMVNPKIKRDTKRIKKEKKEQKRRDKEEMNMGKRVNKEKKREKEKLKPIQNIDDTNKRKRDGDGLEKSVDKSGVYSKEVCTPTKNDTEADHIEKSSLSEEHGQPFFAGSLSYSSDGTQSKTKRIIIEQSPSNVNCTAQGKSVRFRLKQKEKSAHHFDDVPSTSGRTGSPISQTFDNLPPKDEACLHAQVPVADKDKKETIFTTVKVAHGSKDIQPICKSSIEKSHKKPKSAYESLFGNWVPPSIHFEAVTTIEDEKWMLPCKKQAVQNSVHSEFLNGEWGLSCSTAWSHAHLLPEADLYVLPFTVPL